MDHLEKKMVYYLYAYYTIKIAHVFYQIALVFYLFGVYDNKDKMGFCIINGFVLGFIAISFFIKTKQAETLQLRILKWEGTIIAMEMIIFLFALVAYSTLSILIAVKYNDLGAKEKLYYAHHNNQSEIQFNEIDANTAYVYEAIDEHLETTTNILVPDDVSLSNLLSLVIDTENSSEKVNCKRPMNETDIPDSCKHMFEDFYYSYVILELLLPNLLNIIPFAVILATLAYSEYIKGKIRLVAERLRYAQELVERYSAGIASTAAQQNEGSQEEAEIGV